LKGLIFETENQMSPSVVGECRYLDGVANGYAENNRTKEVRRWKARGQGLSEEQKNELLAEAEKKRYERRRQERERFEATAERLSDELQSLPSGVEKTAYHEAKGIEPLPGASVRNGDLFTDPSEIIKQNQGFEISRLLLNQPREQEQHPGIDR
jgi:phage/plasmid primase-like uncharacterized protein